MSTIVVVRKHRQIVIGADTQTSWGSTVESAEYIQNHSKIIKVWDNYLGCVGHASWDLVLMSYFGRQKRKVPLNSPATIFETARKMHVVLKKEYHLNPKEEDDDPFESSQFDCLIANPHGIFGLHALRSVSQYTRFYAIGSGYRFALGAMHALYDTTDSAESIARAGLDAGITFDDGTSAPIEIHALTTRKRTRTTRKK